MSKHKLKTVILMILTGGIIMMTACSEENKTVELAYPVENTAKTTASEEIELSDADYLAEPAQYSEALARLCAVMSASAASGDIPQENFRKLGFSHIAKFSYEKGYREDRVGVEMASKKIGSQTLVFLVARGTQGREWYSNFDVGFETEHKGFSLCADFLRQKLRLYLTNYAIDEDDASYLLTGYSRGAGAVNLLSKRLIDAYGKDRVRAYTFATPNTTTLDSFNSYDGIYNIVKADDVFTSLPLSSWGYHRYGVDLSLSDAPSSPDEVRQVFSQITGDTFRGFDSSESVSRFLMQASELSPTVEAYYHKKYPVGEEELSVYEYMSIAAKFLCEEQTEADGDILMASLDSPFSEVSLFFMEGVELEELLFSGSFERSSAADSHSMLSYLILLNEEP